MINPFLFGKTVTENFFTDREKETHILLSNIEAHVNAIIVSPRRYGKSSLVKNLTSKSSKNTKFVFIDIYNIRSEQEFYNKFSAKIIEATITKFEERVNTLKSLLTSLKPTFSIETGYENSFEVSLNMNGSTTEIEEILNLPEKIAVKKNLNIVICLDEFQNIEFFDDPIAFQKTCRSYWQNHMHISYILYGSKQHMLTNLFQKRSAPFYRFGDVMYLNKIEQTYLIKFVMKRFAVTDKSINENIASQLVYYTKNHPYYTQQLAYILWNLTNITADSSLLQQAKATLLDQNTVFYQSEIEDISNSQVNFLRMIIDGVKNKNSKVAIDKYRLNSSANVARVKKALIKKEVIDVFEKNISFYDPVFELWLRERYFV